MTELREGTVEANGMRFGYLEAGEGPPVLMFHGFPDDAHTWEFQFDALAAAGYRAVAPFMRGYPPSSPAPDGRYDAEALGRDVVGLVEALGDGPAHIVGHDFGAVATYGALAVAPEAFRTATVIAVGHPTTFAPIPTIPRLAHHLFHLWFLGGGAPAPDAILRATDMALIDYLWAHWAPGHDDREHVERLKRETLGPEGALEAALAYYPALVGLGNGDPDFIARLAAPVDVPMLCVFGDRDPVRELSASEHGQFTGPYRQEIVEGAGHFVQRERPERVNELLVEWLGAARETAAA